MPSQYGSPSSLFGYCVTLGCQRNHDRFLIIDDVVYLFGASLKDAGKKLFAYIRMQETSATDHLSI